MHSHWENAWQFNQSPLMNNFLMNKKRLKQQPITHYPWPITLFINAGE